MANFIPSFVFAVTDDEIAAQFVECMDVAPLVSHKINADLAWSTTTRNEWHRYMLEDIQKTCRVPALAYVSTELSLLRQAEIDSAIRAIDGLKAYFLSNPHYLSQIFEHDRKSCEQLQEIIHKAQASKAIEDYRDDKTLAEIFFSFLASQRQAFAEALASGQSVIHVQFHA